MQRRLDDVHEEEDPRADARADQEAGEGGPGPARHRQGLPRGHLQVQQERLAAGDRQVREVDEGVRLFLTLVLSTVPAVPVPVPVILLYVYMFLD